MVSNNETDSDMTETFTNSESDDELDNDSVCTSYEESGSDEEEEEEQDNESNSEEEDIEESLGQRQWRVDRFKPKQFVFDSSESGISSNVPQIDENSVLEYSRLIFDDNLMQIIVEETNRYHLYTMKHANLPKRYHEAIRATTPEMYTFFAIYMLMAHMKKNRIKEYWSTELLISTPIFGSTMSRDRFHLLLRFLHFSDNEKFHISNDKLYKVKSIISYLRQRFRKILVPYQNLCIDESLMLWKDRLSFKQYIPSKRSRLEIKIYVLCDVNTRMILDFIVYTGATTEIRKFPDIGIPGSIVITLLQPYLDRDHHVFLDNWFTSSLLFEKLYARSTGACGTVRKDRVGLPKFEDKIGKGQQVYQNTDNMLALKWHDKREVIMLSTIHEPRIEFTGKKKIQKLKHQFENQFQ